MSRRTRRLREQEQLKKEKPKLIESWEELVGLENDKYYLDINVEMCCGHIRFKEKPEEDTYEHYLSTHSFYGKSYQDYTLILQECGFNVQLKNWDGETVYVELNEQWKHHGICKFCRRDKFCSEACKPAQRRHEHDMRLAIHKVFHDKFGDDYDNAVKIMDEIEKELDKRSDEDVGRWRVRKS